MKKFIFSATIFFFFFVFGSCGHQTLNSLERLVADTSIYSVDTIYRNVNIDGGQFLIKILRDKFDEHLHRFDSTAERDCVTPLITMVIFDKAGKIVYFKKFDHKPDEYLNASYLLFKGSTASLSSSGKLYFAIDENACGSGSGGPEYLVEFKQNEDYKRKEIKLTQIFEKVEIDYAYYSKTDNQIILTKGVWGEGESHFDVHRQHIKVYTYSKGAYHDEDQGITKSRYGSEDQSPEESLKAIHLKEPEKLKSVNINDYIK